MKLAQRRPSYYNVEELGVPINDLDCVATISTFSATLIWLSLPRQGIWMTRKEIADYLALWRYIAYLMGTPTEMFETPEKAKSITEVLLLYEIKPTRTSRILANNILTSLEGQPPSYASRSFLEVNSRFLNGNKLSDALGIGRPSLYYWVLMVGQCLFFMAVCYSYRSIPFLDRRKIQVSAIHRSRNSGGRIANGRLKALRILFWKVLILNESGLGGETKYSSSFSYRICYRELTSHPSFEFKYIPDLSKSTQIEESPHIGSNQSGLERRNLQAFAVACCLLGFLGFICLRICIAVTKRLANACM